MSRFLKNAVHLRSLDVSGCRHVTAEGLKVLPPLSLEKLYVSHCRATNQTAFQEVINNVSAISSVHSYSVDSHVYVIPSNHSTV